MSFRDLIDLSFREDHSSRTYEMKLALPTPEKVRVPRHAARRVVLRGGAKAPPQYISIYRIRSETGCYLVLAAGHWDLPRRRDHLGRQELEGFLLVHVR